MSTNDRTHHGIPGRPCPRNELPQQAVTVSRHKRAENAEGAGWDLVMPEMAMLDRMLFFSSTATRVHRETPWWRTTNHTRAEYIMGLVNASKLKHCPSVPGNLPVLATSQLAALSVS